MNATTYRNVVQALWLRNSLVVVRPFFAIREFAENVTHAAAIQASAYKLRSRSTSCDIQTFEA